MSKILPTQKQEDKALAVRAKRQEEVAKPTAQALDPVTRATLPSHLGNRAIQRLLAQRSGDGAFDLDEATAGRINGARGGGQALDTSVQTKMGESMGADFSGVRVHTGSEAHQLNEQLSAKAFTTGSDIFFREGAYSPQSSSGQELLAHELTHVVQQSTGAVSGGAGGSGSGMTVNAPGDRFEQEADSVAKSVTTAATAPPVQRQTPEEEELQTKRLQRQEMEEDELQMQAMPEEEEPVQMQAMPEEEEVPA
ncbi:MAG: DUF4157 domain-containing protein [Caldilineaceae bacterium]